MIESDRTDASLIAAVAGGDRDAFVAMYARHAPMLMQRLHRRCGDSDIVDTALQDAFVSAWRSAGSYRADRGELGAWLWSIALRRLVDQLRRRRSPVPSPDLPEPEPLPAPGTPAHALLTPLPVELRSVVSAVYLDGLTTAEAGVLLGIPQGTVKSRLARARPLLQEVLR